MSRAQFAGAFTVESDHLEFKAGTSGRQIRETAVAFSNATGGVMLIGLDDRGAPTGRPLDSGTADAIHEALAEARDLGRYELHPLEVDGIQISVLTVARREHGFAQSSDGRVLARRGTRDAPLFGGELQRLINDRSTIRFETTTANVPSREAYSRFVDRLGERFGWSMDTDPAARLEGLGLVSAGELTIAGALYLLTDPADVLGKAYIEVLRFPEDEGSGYQRREEIRGPLDQQVAIAAKLIGEELGHELVVLGLRRYELERIPAVVVRECLANAVAHRSYEAQGTAVRVEIRPSSVRVISPGSLPEPVTVANIREASAARNVDVIRVLRQFRLAEDAGRGVDVMQDTMKTEMLDAPEFLDTGHAVEVVLPLRSAVAPVERAWVRELENRGTLEASDRIVLVHGARGESLTNAHVRALVQTDSRQARAILQRLRDEGLLVQHGQRGAATYRLAESLRPPAGLRMSPDEIADLVHRLADDTSISNADVRSATGLDRVESLSILDRLVRDGRLRRTGQRRGTRYVQA